MPCGRWHLLLLLAFATTLVMASISSTGAEGADTPPATGDWEVGPGETVEHTQETLDLHGDLHVRGTLSLDNSTLWVWLDPDASRRLVVHPGGELHLVNSALAGQGPGSERGAAVIERCQVGR